MEGVDEFEGIGMVERHLADAKEAAGMGSDERFNGGDVLFGGDEKGLAVDRFEFCVEFVEEILAAIVVDMGIDDFGPTGFGGVRGGDEGECG